MIISNCVINLSGEKRRVLREAARVLRPGGRLAVSDVVADPDMDEATRADMQAYTGCIAGTLTKEEFTAALNEAGLTDISISATHRCALRRQLGDHPCREAGERWSGDSGSAHRRLSPRPP